MGAHRVAVEAHLTQRVQSCERDSMTSERWEKRTRPKQQRQRVEQKQKKKKKSTKDRDTTPTAHRPPDQQQGKLISSEQGTCSQRNRPTQSSRLEMEVVAGQSVTRGDGPSSVAAVPPHAHAASSSPGGNEDAYTLALLQTIADQAKELSALRTRNAEIEDKLKAKEGEDPDSERSIVKSDVKDTTGTASTSYYSQRQKNWNKLPDHLLEKILWDEKVAQDTHKAETMNIPIAECLFNVDGEPISRKTYIAIRNDAANLVMTMLADLPSKPMAQKYQTWAYFKQHHRVKLFKVVSTLTELYEPLMLCSGQWKARAMVGRVLSNMKLQPKSEPADATLATIVQTVGMPFSPTISSNTAYSVQNSQDAAAQTVPIREKTSLSSANSRQDSPRLDPQTPLNPRQSRAVALHRALASPADWTPIPPTRTPLTPRDRNGQDDQDNQAPGGQEDQGDKVGATRAPSPSSPQSSQAQETSPDETQSTLTQIEIDSLGRDVARAMLDDLIAQQKVTAYGSSPQDRTVKRLLLVHHRTQPIERALLVKVQADTTKAKSIKKAAAAAQRSLKRKRDTTAKEDENQGGNPH